MKAEWSTDWPDEIGSWWFYGWKFGETSEKPSLVLVNVRRAGRNNGLMIVGEGHFWYAAEGAIGLFAKADLPCLPTYALSELAIKEASDVPEV